MRFGIGVIMDLPQMAFVRNRDGDLKRNYVLRAAPGFITVARPTKLCAVSQSDVTQLTTSHLTLDRGLYSLAYEARAGSSGV